MKTFKFISLICIAIISLTIVSCAKDIIDVNGSITGVVKDYDDGHLIQNCQVALSPNGYTSITGTDGQFNFSDLEPGSYTLSFTKSGYEDQSKVVSVTSSQTTDASLTMKSKGSFALSETILNFGDLSSNMSFTISNNSDTNCSFEISNIPSWASFSSTSGSVTAENTSAISVTVDRSKVDYGAYTQTVQIAYKGAKSGNATITLNMSKVKLTAPEVGISTSAQNITQNSFDIGGQITATGGATITDYGHCWSLKHNPTVNDNHSSNGTTQSVGEFTTTISNLTVGTTYYVRAYATNSQGTAYSSEVTVTTQEAASKKWDGTVAKSFAGGKGTVGSPYKIETGGQLLHMKDIDTSGKYFVLMNNIDLDNNNWLPFEFNGYFDGQGYTISNLYVNRSDDEQGLFATTDDAVVQNLNIKGVKIEAENNGRIGTLFGYMKNGTISNVNVIFLESSSLLGTDNVGGLIGLAGDYVKIENCHVYSVASTNTISGSNSVGGLCGHGACLTLCSANVNVVGRYNHIGGLIGFMPRGSVSKCEYIGDVSGAQRVGGICGNGNGYNEIIASRAIANIKVKDCYAGGITGEGGTVIACYSDGTITGGSSSTVSTVSGLDGSYNEKPCLCYTTMDCGFGNGCKDCATTASKGGGTNTAVNCTNITKHLQEAYSEYAEYYDFNSTWTWTGKVDGKEVSVSCPKLAWESVNTSSSKRRFARYKK